MTERSSKQEGEGDALLSTGQVNHTKLADTIYNYHHDEQSDAALHASATRTVHPPPKRRTNKSPPQAKPPARLPPREQSGYHTASMVPCERVKRERRAPWRGCNRPEEQVGDCPRNCQRRAVRAGHPQPGWVTEPRKRFGKTGTAGVEPQVRRPAIVVPTRAVMRGACRHGDDHAYPAPRHLH